MSGFFQVVGIITCVVLVGLFLTVLYTLFIHPVFQALSVMRYVCACERVADPGVKLTLRTRWKAFIWGYEIGGISATRYSCRFGEWSGIGKWRIYQNEDE